MKHSLIGCFVFLLSFLSVTKADTHWQCDVRSFQYDMSMYITVYENGVKADRWDELEVGAFFGTECRGVASVEKLTDKAFYYYLRVRSNTVSGETITFKVYDSSKDEEMDVTETVPFESLGRFGYPGEPFILNFQSGSDPGPGPGPGPDPNPVTGIVLNKTRLTLKVTETETLIATIAPDNAENKKVQWNSNNELVATVDQNGKVSALKAGTASISVTTEDGGFKAECNLTVIQPVTGVSLNKSEIELKTGETGILIATVSPSDASEKNVNWESEDEMIASVDQNGKITALNPGNTSIIVTSVDGGFTASCRVKVLLPSGLDSVRDNSIRIFPSESKNSYYIKNVPAGTIIKIIDTNGRIVKSVVSTGELMQLITLNDLPVGICFIHLRTSQETFTKAFVKE